MGHGENTEILRTLGGRREWGIREELRGFDLGRERFFFFITVQNDKLIACEKRFHAMKIFQLTIIANCHNRITK